MLFFILKCTLLRARCLKAKQVMHDGKLKFPFEEETCKILIMVNCNALIILNDLSQYSAKVIHVDV